MSSINFEVASLGEAVKVLKDVALLSNSRDIQKHALDLVRDLEVFQQLKKWSDDIMASNRDVANKAEALVNLRIVGSMVLKGGDMSQSVRDMGLEMGLISTNMSNVGRRSGTVTTPNLMDFTPTDGIFDTKKVAKHNPSPSLSRHQHLSDGDYASSPSPKRKSLTVKQATHLADVRRNSIDKGKQPATLLSEPEMDGSDDANLISLLRKTLNVPGTPTDPSAVPKPNVKDESKKQPNWVKVGSWYMDLNDEENAGISPFLRATNTISKIMDTPGYGENLRAAEDAIKANKDFDPINDTPAVINSLFATDPEKARSLWEQDTKSTVLEARSEVKVPTLHALPKSRKSSPHAFQIPEITVTEAPNQSAERTGLLGAGLGIDRLPFTRSVFDLKPDVPYEATLPLLPVPTHPQTFKYTPTRIPPLEAPFYRYSGGSLKLSRGGTKVFDDGIDFDKFIPEFKAMMAKSKPPTTIPKKHDNPLIAAELALLQAQTILPRGCNLAFKEVCPCELSGRECPFKVTCSLKRCYHESEVNNPQSVFWMHPSIRPSCVAWLRGDKDCGHNKEEKVSGEFGHDEKATRDWQGSNMRIRLHLAWNI